MALLAQHTLSAGREEVCGVPVDSTVRPAFLLSCLGELDRVELGEGRANDGSWGRMSPKRGQWDQSQGGNTGQSETRLPRKQTSTVLADKYSGQSLHQLSFARGWGGGDSQLQMMLPHQSLSEFETELRESPCLAP